MKQYNYLGEIISPDKQYVYLDRSFAKPDGSPDWDKWIINGDKEGFDLNHPREKTVLPVGTRLIRYGNDQGNFSTTPGTAYEALSLPYCKESMEYHEYIVISKCEVQCIVDKGVAAKGFKQPGGGTQYYHLVNMHDSIRGKILEEDRSWLKTTQKQT